MKHLPTLKPGDLVYASRPYGHFTMFETLNHPGEDRVDNSVPIQDNMCMIIAIVKDNCNEYLAYCICRGTLGWIIMGDFSSL